MTLTTQPVRRWIQMLMYAQLQMVCTCHLIQCLLSELALTNVQNTGMVSFKQNVSANSHKVPEVLELYHYLTKTNPVFFRKEI